MKSSEELRIGHAIIAALERVRLQVCRTGSAAQWHMTRAANVVRKPKLAERIAPHLEGDAVKEYVASLPALIEETRKLDAACEVLWEKKQAGAKGSRYDSENERLIGLLLRYDFSLRSYEKLARQPEKMLAEMGAKPVRVAHESNGAAHDEPQARMSEKEFAELEEQIEKELQSVDAARAELVAAHEALVVKGAEKSSEPIEEATAYARSGLLKAGENFDVRRGFRFSTYARWWIKTAIKEKKSWDA